MSNGLGGFSTTTTVFGAGLVVALLVGLFTGAGGGLAIVAIVLLASAIVLLRSDQATVAGETSAVFRPSGPGRPTARTLDSELPPAPVPSPPASAQVSEVSDKGHE